MGGLIPVLLIIAVVMILIQDIQGRRSQAGLEGEAA
jgi:hypothetical protein